MHGLQKEGLQVLTLAEMKFNQGVFASGTAAWPPCCCGTQNKELLPTRTGTSHRNREPPDYSTSVFHRQEQARHKNCIFLIMAPGQKAYPRGTVKKIVKAHSNCNLSKNVDVMVSSLPTRRGRAANQGADLSRLRPVHADVSRQCRTLRGSQC